MNGPQYVRFLLVPISFMAVFYTNYFLLIDRYLTTRRFGRFTGYNLLFIAVVMILVHLLFRYVLPPTCIIRRWHAPGSIRYASSRAT